MYCVVGEKVLRCEVSERLENFSWVRIGKSEKGQTVPNNRIFEEEYDAHQFLKNRVIKRVSTDTAVANEVNACKKLYDDFYEETGITVRIIDRLYKSKDVEKQLAHLRKKYNKSEAATQPGVKTPTDSRVYSGKPSSQFKTKKVYTDDPDYKPSAKFSKGSKPTGGAPSKTNKKQGTSSKRTQSRSSK